MAEGVRGRPWKKGESGNPKGRPKGSKSLDVILREKLAKVPAGKGRVALAEKLVDKAIKDAMKGDQAALKFLWERHDGKLAQIIDAAVTVDADGARERLLGLITSGDAEDGAEADTGEPE